MALHQSNPYHPTAASSRVVASDGLRGVDDAGQICRVILTGLPKDDDVTETAVLELVESAIKAEAASARLTYDSTGQCLGLAIVTLFSFAHAKKLYEEIDGMIIDGDGERLSQSAPLPSHNERLTPDMERRNTHQDSLHVGAGRCATQVHNKPDNPTTSPPHCSCCPCRCTSCHQSQPSSVHLQPACDSSDWSSSYPASSIERQTTSRSTCTDNQNGRNEKQLPTGKD
jgi:hypothetical protein